MDPLLNLLRLTNSLGILHGTLGEDELCQQLKITATATNSLHPRNKIWLKMKKPQSKIIPKAVKVEVPSLEPEQKKKLFVLLREERSRLAQERNLKAYLIFHDKTLIEMSERLLDSKHAMLEVSDVTPEKYETYGVQFIAVIRKFKEDLDVGNKRDQA
jgi:ATP-dependent DNA helicase RecQ